MQEHEQLKEKKKSKQTRRYFRILKTESNCRSIAKKNWCILYKYRHQLETSWFFGYISHLSSSSSIIQYLGRNFFFLRIILVRCISSFIGFPWDSHPNQTTCDTGTDPLLSPAQLTHCGGHFSCLWSHFSWQCSALLQRGTNGRGVCVLM